MNFFNNNNRCNNGYCNNNQNDSCCNEQDHYFDGTESGRYCSGAYYYTSCGWNQTCFSTSCYNSDSVNELFLFFRESPLHIAKYSKGICRKIALKYPKYP